MKKHLNVIALITVLVLVFVVYFLAQKNTSNGSATADNVYKNTSLYTDKSITMQGYILGIDIKSELDQAHNQYLNLRNSPDMKSDKIISMKIVSDAIRKSLITAYTSGNANWINVQVSGILHSVSLPINGSSITGWVLDVDTLVIK